MNHAGQRYADEAQAPHVSVVIVTYNSHEWLPGCMASLDGATIDDTVEVIVVDNDSADGSAAWVAASRPSATLIRNRTNVGFAAAVNQGARQARGKYLVLVNPDGYLRPGAIDALVRFAQANPRFVIVGGRTISESGETDSRSCWASPTLWSLLCSAVMLSTIAPGSRLFDPEAMGYYRRDQPRRVDIVSGCLLAIAMVDWRRLGGLDEQYFVYGEDADLCLRAASVTGRGCAITPDAVMMHAVGGSSASTAAKHELVLRGRITLVKRHLGHLRGRIGAGLIVLGVGIRASVASLGAARGSAWRDVWRHKARWRDGYPPIGEAHTPTTTASPVGGTHA